MARPTPYELVFASLGEERFPPIRSALAESARPAADRDAFLMEREVVLLLRDLRPEDGVGEGMDQLAALVHHAYLFWNAGQATVDVSAEQLSGLLQPAGAPAEGTESASAFYARFPERKIWAEVVAGTPPEPLDGCFLHPDPAGALRVLGAFGVHPERMGLSVVEVTGPRPGELVRTDGTPVFSSTLAGGAAAGLYSIAGAEELLELGWRTAEGSVAWTR